VARGELGFGRQAVSRAVAAAGNRLAQLLRKLAVHRYVAVAAQPHGSLYNNIGRTTSSAR